jgi:hypothetical protein
MGVWVIVNFRDAARQGKSIVFSRWYNKIE